MLAHQISVSGSIQLDFSNFTVVLDHGGGNSLDGAMKVIVGVVIGVSAAVVVITLLLFGIVLLIIKNNQGKED